MVSSAGTTTHTYLYAADGTLIREIVDNPNGTQDIMEFLYDHAGQPYSFVLNNAIYFYVVNLQGDVVRIVDGYGRTVSSYVYNAWGKQISATSSSLSNAANVTAKNPLRYRGYYYDTETKLYYLQSRYYNPEMGRFINADDTTYLGADGTQLSYNLYAYCANNPINRTDTYGNWSGWATAGVIVGAALVIAAITVLTCGVGTATLAGAVAVGAAKGALVGAAVGTAAGAGIGYATTGTLQGAATGAAIGFGAGAIVGAVAGGTSAGLKFGTFSSKTSLAEHFAKHGDEFGDMYSNAQEYADGAKYVIKNGTYIPEKNAYIKFLGNQGKANYAFVGLKSGGRVSTYHVRSVGKMIKDGVSLFA